MAYRESIKDDYVTRSRTARYLPINADLSGERKYCVKGTKCLVAPFEEELAIYVCECPSCILSNRYKYLLAWFCVGGFLLPLFWIANMFLYVYVQWLPPHEPKHRQLETYELPTEYEAEKRIKRSLFRLDCATVEYMNSINDSQGSQCAEFKNSGPDNPIEQGRLHLLVQVAAEVISNHDTVRTQYKRWLAFVLLGVTFYSAAIPLAVKASTE